MARPRSSYFEDNAARKSYLPSPVPCFNYFCVSPMRAFVHIVQLFPQFFKMRLVLKNNGYFPGRKYKSFVVSPFILTIRFFSPAGKRRRHSPPSNGTTAERDGLFLVGHRIPHLCVVEKFIFNKKNRLLRPNSQFSFCFNWRFSKRVVCYYCKPCFLLLFY